MHNVFAPTACGSLKENIRPGDLVFPDQFIDRTAHRKQTFYEGEQVCHISVAEPFCAHLRSLLSQKAAELNLTHHETGTLITIEGPRFSTKAESGLFRTWGCDVINMTTVPECVLAREAGMCYQPIAMVTDYDCWKSQNYASLGQDIGRNSDDAQGSQRSLTEHNVNLVDIIKLMEKNADKVIQLLLKTIPNVLEQKGCQCSEAIKSALV